MLVSVFIEANEIQLPVKFIDTRFNLLNTTEGKHQYDLGHIDGAVYFDLNEDLSDLTSVEGRHPMPSHEGLTDLFERSGLQLDDEIIIYDQGAAPYSSRAWFILTYAGFSNVKIVNGGLEALLEAGYSLTKDVPNVERTSIQPKWATDLVASREEVLEVTAGQKEAVLVDARNYRRYIGEIEPIDPIAGHIPTAQNFDWEQLLVGQKIANGNVLLERFDRDQSYIVYCGSGVTASPLFTSLLNEGYENVQLYVGGYSDWIRTYPIAIGDETK
jgi:thiosulfate/3-mercaptopyruvate sulfurtransferase